MRIKEVVCAYLKESLVFLECEHCGNIERGCVELSSDYIDDVLPTLHCEVCGKSSLDNANQVK